MERYLPGRYIQWRSTGFLKPSVLKDIVFVRRGINWTQNDAVLFVGYLGYSRIVSEVLREFQLNSILAV